MGSLKIGVALWSFGGTSTEDELRQRLDSAVNVSVKAVQPWCVDGDGGGVCVLDPDRCKGAKRSEMRKLIESRGLAISGFCAQLSGPSGCGGLGDEQGLDARVEKTKGALELAADMGAPIVTTHVGVIPEGRADSAYRVFLQSCGQIVRHGEKVGAVFAMETGQEPAHVLKSFMEDLNSPAAKVNYDPANMLRFGPVDGVRTLADYIVHTHAKDRNPQTGKPTVGQGAVPWDEYIAALKSIGYDGWFALEDESGQQVEASIAAGRTFLERY